MGIGVGRTGVKRRMAGMALVVISLVFAVPTAGAAPASAQCDAQAGSVKVESSASPATVTVTDLLTGDAINVVVTISGPSFTIVPLNATGPLANAAWCVKSATDTNAGTGTSGQSTSVNKHGIVHDIGYVVVYSVSTTPKSVCWRSSGRAVDFKYFGPIDRFGNAENYTTHDGTCSGSVFTHNITVVSAPNSITAATKCASLGALYPRLHLADIWPAAPSDYWAC
jgi:hypothetical protein